jgi:hypothetical protein
MGVGSISNLFLEVLVQWLTTPSQSVRASPDRTPFTNRVA